MAQNYAEYRGEQGENRVRAVIDEMSSLGYLPLHNLLLITSRNKSTQIDHLIIDRFGILVVETKNVGGMLRGKSGEKNWTICYPDGKHRPMLSPIEQNELHRKRLHQFLLAQGMQLKDNYVQTLIVFADGRIDALELDASDSMRVTTLEGAREFLRARYDFQPNEGMLTDLLVEDYAAQLTALDRSGDPEAVARHVAQAQAAKSGRSRSGGSRRAARPVAPPHVAENRGPSSKPTPSHAPARRTVRTPARPVGAPEPFGVFIGRLLREALSGVVRPAAVGLVAILLMTVGVPLFTKALMAVGTSMQQSATATTAAAPSANPALAFQRLQEADPELAAAVTNRDTPQIGSERGMTTYTWEYLQKKGKRAVDVKTVSVALDASGNIVGSP